MKANETRNIDAIRASFLILDDKGRAKKVNENKLFEYLKKTEHIRIWNRDPYIYEGGAYVADDDGAVMGIRIKAKIMDLIWPDFRTASLRDRIYDRVISEKDFSAKQEDMPPKTWINFKNGFFDASTGEMHPHDPKYFSLNQIPYEWKPEEVGEGKATEEFLNFALYKEGMKKLFLQYAGLMLTTDTRFQKFLLLTGQGGNGKSVLLDMVEKIVGRSNVSRMSMNKINNSNFATSQMVGKLGNICADLKTDVKRDVANLKMITGDDDIDAERKHARGFSFRPYAKLLFSSNEVPRLIGEESDAIYRRMMILTVDRKPEKPDIDLKAKLDAEAPYFLKLCVDALRELYADGGFVACPSSTEAVENARRDNNSTDAFLQERCDVSDVDAKSARTSVFESYRSFCESEGRIPKSNVQFYSTLRQKGFVEVKVNGTRYIKGIRLKADVENIFEKNEKTEEEKKPDLAEVMKNIEAIKEWLLSVEEGLRQ